jgi:glycosyltransferase involved in cell wall biosynthesis
MTSLLVYIPTFNRPEHLESQLKALRPQLEENNRVRLIVADNASTKEESLNLRTTMAREKWLTFKTRLGNIEANANILLGFLECDVDEYLWILADDTAITDDCLDLILNQIDDSTADLIGMGFLEESPQWQSIDWEPGVVAKIMGQTRWGLISSAVYKASYFAPVIKEAFFFHNSSFPHLAVLLSGVRWNRKLSVSWLEETLIHGGNSVDLPSDYSLALSGAPHLFLIEDNISARRKLVKSWLKTYGSAFMEARRRERLAGWASLHIVVKYGGIFGLYRLTIGSLEVSFRRTALGRRLEKFVESRPSLMSAIQNRNGISFRVRDK